MEGSLRYLKAIKYLTMAQPNAADLWVVAVSVVSAFGHEVPWYMWMMMIFEIFVSVIQNGKATGKISTKVGV